MYTSINFLKERNRIQELTLIRDRKIATVTSVVLGIFMFVTVSLLAYQLFLKTKLNSLKTATLGQQQILSSQAKTQSTYVSNTKKLATVQQIFNKRGDKWGAITFLYGLLPTGATIGSVDLQADGTDSLAFSVTTNNIFTFESLSKVLQSDTVSSSGFGLNLGTLSRTKDGIYRVDIKLTSVAQAKPATGVSK